MIRQNILIVIPQRSQIFIIITVIFKKKVNVICQNQLMILSSKRKCTFYHYTKN